MKTLYFTGVGIIAMIAFFSTIDFSFAQDKRTYNVKNSQWSELNLVGRISNKFEYQLDWQYRRQSEQVGYQTNPNLTNIWLNPYQNVFRPWIHFFPESTRKVRFSVSPIGFWGTFGPAGSNGTVKAPGESANDELLEYPEIRSCYQVTTYDQIGRVKLQYRARFEFRWIGVGQPSTVVHNGSGFDFFHGFPMTNRIHKYRFRFYTRADIALKGNTIDEKEFYLAIADELWVGMGVKTGNANFLDQNRAYAGVGYKIAKDIRLEIGYLNQIIPQNTYTNRSYNVRNMDFNNVLHFFVFLDNFNRFFEKKKERPLINE
jgi:hypothetical protein